MSLCSFLGNCQLVKAQNFVQQRALLAEIGRLERTF
jgi:hypothetical protein